jgi:hypothetical protein
MRFLLLFLLPLALLGQTRSIINTGATANDGTGDSARTAFNKVNTNFATLWAVIYTNQVGTTNAFRFSTNAFLTSGTNVSLANTIYLTNKLTIEGSLTNDVEFGDIARLELDSTDASLSGVASIYIDGGITTVRGVTNLQVITPGVFAGSAAVGQVLKLTDKDEGSAEFSDVVESVSTVAEMLEMSGRTSKSVRTLGYASAGDGGGGVYYWVNSTASTNAYGGRISNGIGSWALLDRPVSLFQFGLRSGNTSEASNNAARIQSAIIWAASGGHLILPNNGSTVFVGPNSIRPNTAITNLTLELHGVIQVPATPTWNATHPSLFHFVDAGTYNNLSIIGTATINGNATNQTTSSGNNYGKQMGFWFDNATNLTVSGIKVEAFGSFGIYVRNSDRAQLRDLRIVQTHGNNDTLPTRWGVNADGIHVGNSRNVSITGCDIESTDDCISFTQYAANQVSTNFLVANNILRPYAPNSGNPPSAIRISSESGILNTLICDVIVKGNIIKPVGANGMYIGVIGSTSSRELKRVKITGNVIDGANQLGAVRIGPNAGAATTHNTVFSGAVSIQHADDIDVSNNTIANSRAKAISLANCGHVTLRGNVISNVLDSVGSASPRGVAVYLPWGSYGDTDDVTIEGNTITGTDGGAIYGDGASFNTKVLRVRNNVISGWLRGLYASQSRNHPAILANRGLTNLIEGNRFVNGEGSTIVISPSSTSSRHEIINNTMPTRITTPGSGVGGTEHIRVTLAGSTAGAVLRVSGNTIGAYEGRAIFIENIASAHIIGNQFLPDQLASTVSGEMISANFTTNSTGSALYILGNNTAHIASKLGSAPSSFFRTYNNNGSGGSTVTLTTVAAQNIITPASGMSHVVDAFAGGSRDLTYGATTTIPNSAELPIRHRVALTGDTTLAWTSPSPGQRGTLDIYPDTSTRTVTLPSLAYSPTGSTFTVAGGTGSTNYVRAMWEVHQVGGTNRITVVPTAIYR